MKKGIEMHYKAWMPLAEIKKALMIASPCIAGGLGAYILLGRQDWYRDMGKYFDENPLALAIIVACGLVLVLASVVFFTGSRAPDAEEDES